MRLALVRQRYSAYGGAERFIERALGALGGQGVAVTVLAREWIGAPGGLVRSAVPIVNNALQAGSGVAKRLRSKKGGGVLSQSRCEDPRAGTGYAAQMARSGLSLKVGTWGLVPRYEGM